MGSFAVASPPLSRWPKSLPHTIGYPALKVASGPPPPTKERKKKNRKKKRKKRTFREIVSKSKTSSDMNRDDYASPDLSS